MSHPLAVKLGRISMVDARDRNFPLAALSRRDLTPPLYKTWRTGPVLDQGETPQCVGYSWKQWLMTSPVRNYGLNGTTIYNEAQKLDGEPLPHDGSSVRAGAKALTDDKYVSAYHWATSVSDMVSWLLTQGPMVIGVNWYEDMFDPPSSGIVSCSGQIAGGHAICVNGYNTKTKLFRLTNSWGTSWGINGRFYIRKDDMARLCFQEDGEACTAAEILVK